MAPRINFDLTVTCFFCRFAPAPTRQPRTMRETQVWRPLNMNIVKCHPVHYVLFMRCWVLLPSLSLWLIFAISPSQLYCQYQEVTSDLGFPLFWGLNICLFHSFQCLILKVSLFNALLYFQQDYEWKEACVPVSRRTEAVETAEFPPFLQSRTNTTQLLPEHTG